MAKESSFDVVSSPDLSELQNALDQARREVVTRYDFRGHDVSITWDASAWRITLDAPSGMVMDSLQTVLTDKMAKRGVALRFLEFGNAELHGMERATLPITVKNGIETPKAKEIQKAIRGLDAKVDVQIQGDALRVTSKNKDDLQKVIQSLKSQDFGIELSFTNYR